MALSPNALIATEKLTKYLLLFRKHNDKSNWLATAGYNLENWRELENDLRVQILSLEPIPVECTRYGQMFEIKGRLKGPNGKNLAVNTKWMIENETGITKFLTLYPDKGTKK